MSGSHAGLRAVEGACQTAVELQSERGVNAMKICTTLALPALLDSSDSMLSGVKWNQTIRLLDCEIVAEMPY